jgi:hypothetical protein
VLRSSIGPTGFAVLALLSLLSWGCTTGGVVPSFVYEGERRTPQGKTPLARFDAIPPGYEVLGNVTARCQRERPREQHFEVALGTLGCSPSSLTQSLEELAVEAGGTALYRFRCDEQSSGSDGVLSPDCFECSAGVLTNTAQFSGSTQVRQNSRFLATATVKFDSDGVLDAPRSEATEVPYQPIADRRVGTLAVTLDERVTAADASVAILRAAAALGALHVVSPKCFWNHRDRKAYCFAVVTTPRFES